MDNYVTGAAIKRLREKKEMTQAELADKIGVTAKAVSKWETAKGLPDISLIEPLAAALGAYVGRNGGERQCLGKYAQSKALCLSRVRQRDTRCRRGGNKLLRSQSAAA